MKTCSNCGKEIEPAAKFCTNCGTPTDGVSEPLAVGGILLRHQDASDPSNTEQSPGQSDPGATIRTAGLVILAILFVGGIVAMINGSAQTEIVSEWDERVVTNAGLGWIEFGSALVAAAGSFLLPLLSFAAWKTSKHRCQQAKRVLDGDSEAGSVHFSAAQLVGSVKGWAAWWRFLSFLNLFGFVLCTLIELCGETKTLCVMWGQNLDPTVLFAPMISVGIFMCFWAICLMEHVEEAHKIARKLQIHARGDVGKWKGKQIQSIVDGMVSIPGKPFLAGKFQTTQAQWEAVTGKAPSEHEGDELPVENVSWDDCQEFLKILNELPAAKGSRLVFRLPTAEEWEFACRAGATGDYCRLPDGTEISEYTLDEVAWYSDDTGPHPVGRKKPNAFGLFDMHGNVWEWTSSEDGENNRICLGGSFFSTAETCKSSNRIGASPSDRYSARGFRIFAEKVV